MLLNPMQIPKFWHRFTTTRHARTLEAELVLERAVVIQLDAVIAQQGVQIDQQGAEINQQGIEIARLRAENRALLNSILGIAGVPPLPATEADLAALQPSPFSGTGPAGRRDRKDEAGAKLLSRNPSDLASSAKSHLVNARGLAEARPTEDSLDTPAADFARRRLAGAFAFGFAQNGTARTAAKPKFKNAGKTPAVRRSQHQPEVHAAARRCAHAPPFLAPNPPSARIRIRAKRKARRGPATACPRLTSLFSSVGFSLRANPIAAHIAQHLQHQTTRSFASSQRNTFAPANLRRRLKPTLLNRFFGGSPLLQQRELDFSPAKKRREQIVALATGIRRLSAKARDKVAVSVTEL